jgi:hypothetical protein
MYLLNQWLGSDQKRVEVGFASERLPTLKQITL